LQDAENVFDFLREIVRVDGDVLAAVTDGDADVVVDDNVVVVHRATRHYLLSLPRALFIERETRACFARIGDEKPKTLNLKP
jgi:hypothetical protein